MSDTGNRRAATSARQWLGLIEGGAAHLEGVRSPQTRDLMMVAHCLRIERYEMAAYEFVTILSSRLGLMRETSLLAEFLSEEKDMAADLMRLEPSLFDSAYSHAAASMG